MPKKQNQPGAGGFPMPRMPAQQPAGAAKPGTVEANLDDIKAQQEIADQSYKTIQEEKLKHPYRGPNLNEYLNNQPNWPRIDRKIQALKQGALSKKNFLADIKSEFWWNFRPWERKEDQKQNQEKIMEALENYATAQEKIKQSYANLGLSYAAVNYPGSNEYDEAKKIFEWQQNNPTDKEALARLLSEEWQEGGVQVQGKGFEMIGFKSDGTKLTAVVSPQQFSTSETRQNFYEIKMKALVKAMRNAGCAEVTLTNADNGQAAIAAKEAIRSGVCLTIDIGRFFSNSEVKRFKEIFDIQTTFHKNMNRWPTLGETFSRLSDGQKQVFLTSFNDPSLSEKERLAATGKLYEDVSSEAPSNIRTLVQAMDKDHKDLLSKYLADKLSKSPVDSTEEIRTILELRELRGGSTDERALFDKEVAADFKGALSTVKKLPEHFTVRQSSSFSVFQKAFVTLWDLAHDSKTSLADKQVLEHKLNMLLNRKPEPTAQPGQVMGQGAPAGQAPAQPGQGPGQDPVDLKAAGNQPVTLTPVVEQKLLHDQAVHVKGSNVPSFVAAYEEKKLHDDKVVQPVIPSGNAPKPP